MCIKLSREVMVQNLKQFIDEKKNQKLGIEITMIKKQMHQDVEQIEQIMSTIKFQCFTRKKLSSDANFRCNQTLNGGKASIMLQNYMVNGKFKRDS